MKIISDPDGGAEVIVALDDAVLPVHAEVAMLAYAGDPGPTQVIALELEGPRIAGDLTVRSDEVYLLDASQAARLITLVVGVVAQSADSAFAAEFGGQLEGSLNHLRAARPGGESS